MQKATKVLWSDLDKVEPSMLQVLEQMCVTKVVTSDQLKVSVNSLILPNAPINFEQIIKDELEN